MQKKILLALFLFSFFSPVFAINSDTKFFCPKNIARYAQIKNANEHVEIVCYKRDNAKTKWRCPNPENKTQVHKYESSLQNKDKYITQKKYFYVPTKVFKNKINWVNDFDNCGFIDNYIEQKNENHWAVDFRK